MSIKLTCGFLPVDLSVFRSKSLSKGKKLIESHHVSDVQEIIENNSQKFTGLVLRETPGAHTTKKNENIYKVEIQLLEDRKIFDTNCSCKGGRGFCKHAAAVCLYVNLENTFSKTDKPMIWNKPPEEQLQKYHKGSRMECMFPCDLGNREKELQLNYFENAENMPSKLWSENSMQCIAIQTEIIAHKNKEANSKEKEKQDLLLNLFLQNLYTLQVDNTIKEYTIMTCTFLEENKLKISKQKPVENDYFTENISVDQEKWIAISFSSAGQSESEAWFQERFIRITASSRAHKIRTRVTNFEGLTQQFLKDKRYYNIPKAMRYGLETEIEARNAFQIITGLIVQEVGLIVSVTQPFLACSPDGIIFNNDIYTYEILEIKCPYTCKETVIIDVEKKEINLPYLIFNDKGEVELKKNHQYYTQIQFSMYVVRVKTCHFFVYSSIDNVHIIINKDEDLLSTLIPKIENYYYQYFLPMIQRKQQHAERI